MTSSRFKLIDAAQHGDVDALLRFREEMGSLVGINAKLLALAAREAGTPDDRAAIVAHEQSGEWATHVPLGLTEVAPVVGDPPDCSRTIEEEVSHARWGEQHMLALASSDDGDGARAAAALVDDLHTAAASMAESARRVLTLRRVMRERGVHAMQAAGFLRVQNAARTHGVKSVVEIGAADGELVDALCGLGLDAHGADVLASAHPRVRLGNFLVDAPGAPVDLVVATALLEWGSGIDADVLEDPTHALQRLGALVHRDGGIVVLENVRLPLPFRPEQAVESGFVVVDDRVPSPTLALGGRGITLIQRK